MIPRLILKLVMPQVIKLLVPVKKYCFEDNELDIKCRDLEQKCTDIGFKVEAMKTLIKDLDDKSHPPAIDLEEWEDVKDTIKKIKNKKVFKSLNAKK
tara:strand:+ start:163 stop:453 length:291 start_codon:yes stop_codon:yes gene_type:complete